MRREVEALRKRGKPAVQSKQDPPVVSLAPVVVPQKNEKSQKAISEIR